MNYCIYLRKSRSDIEAEARGEGETLSRHRAALLEYARKHELSITEIYEEVVSGETIAARPVMQKLLAEVGERKWNGVLVMEVERLARGDTMDQGLVAQTFKYSETLIITPLKTYDPNDEYDEEYFEFGLFMSRREYKTIRRRLQRGREAAAKEGKCLSRAPYGYKRVKLENDKGYSMEIVPEQAEVVRLMYDWYINGAETEGVRKRLGIQAIARRLNELSIPAIRHDYWQKETVRDILINPTYAGLIRWGYRKQKKKLTPEGVVISRPVTNDECIISKGLHEAIIPREQWDKAQELFAEQPPAPVGYKSAVKNPLSGLVVCAKCSRKMVMRKGSGNRPDYLVCHARSCDMVSTPLHYVEERVLDILQDWAEEYRVEPKDFDPSRSESEVIASALERKEKELDKLKAQLKKAHELVELEVYSVQEFTARAKELRANIAELEAERSRLKGQRVIAEQRHRAKIEFAPKVEELLRIYGKLDTAAEKNELLKQVLEKAVYNKAVSAKFKGQRADNFDLVAYPRLPKADDNT